MSNYYVSTTGDNSSADPTNPATPWRTLAKAAATVPSGAVHTINVAAGTYNEGVTDYRSGASAGQYRHWKSTVAGGAISYYFYLQEGNYVKIEGFTLTGGPGATTAGAINYEGTGHYFLNNTITLSFQREGITTNSATSSYCVIEGNTITQAYGCFMNITGSNHQILNNNCSRVKDDPWDLNFIWIYGSGHLVKGNYFHDFRWTDSSITNAHVDAFQSYPAGGGSIAVTNTIFEQNHISLVDESTGIMQPFAVADESATVSVFMFAGTSNLTIRNNIFEGMNGFKSGGNGGGNSNILFYNNVFRGDREGQTWENAGAVLENSSSTIKFYNNIFINFDKCISSVGTTGLEGDYNLFWNSNSDAIANLNYTVNTNDLANINPLIASMTLNTAVNYNLQASSPCKDTGSPNTGTYGVTDDYAGTSRPLGSGYDRGAYEYVGGIRTLFRP